MIQLEKSMLQEFMEKCLESKPNYIVPIPSEGVAMVSLTIDQVLSSGCKMIYADRLVRADPKQFSGQTALVIDFSMFRGKMMNLVVNQLLSFGASVQKASFVVHEECADEASPAKYFIKMPHDEYILMKDQFIDMYLQESHPYDSDHWDIKLKMTPLDVDSLVSTVCQLGRVFQVSEPGDRILRMTLELDSQCIAKNVALPKKAPLDTVCKIRFFIDEGSNEISVVGLFFPSIPIESHGSRHRCVVPVKELSACHMLEKRGWRPKSRDCFDSCSFYSNLLLVKALIQSLRGSLPNVTFAPIVDNRVKLHFAALFPLVSEDLWPSVQSFLWGEAEKARYVLEAFTQPLEEYPSESVLMGDSYIHEVVAAEVYKGWKHAVASQEIAEPEAFENLGVSFQELCETTKGRISPRAISRAFDVLLDVGVIRPVVTSKLIGMNGAKCHAWTRAYRPAGEQVGRLLKYLSRVRSGGLL